MNPKMDCFFHCESRDMLGYFFHFLVTEIFGLIRFCQKNVCHTVGLSLIRWHLQLLGFYVNFADPTHTHTIFAREWCFSKILYNARQSSFQVTSNEHNLVFWFVLRWPIKKDGNSNKPKQTWLCSKQPSSALGGRGKGNIKNLLKKCCEALFIWN